MKTERAERNIWEEKGTIFERSRKPYTNKPNFARRSYIGSKVLKSLKFGIPSTPAPTRSLIRIFSICLFIYSRLNSWFVPRKKKERRERIRRPTIIGWGAWGFYQGLIRPGLNFHLRQLPHHKCLRGVGRWIGVNRNPQEGPIPFLSQSNLRPLL